MHAGRRALSSLVSVTKLAPKGRFRKAQGASPGPLRRSGRNLARGERFLRTPGTRAYVTNAPRQGRGEFLQPLPGCVSLLLVYPGGRFAHPRLSSFRPAGADFGTAEVVPSRLWL